MRNINWSKWIAIALSIFIVTQFIQVSFLAAGQIESSRSDAGADASRGSLAEGIYQDVWEKVGDGSDMILSAKADTGVTIVVIDNADTPNSVNQGIFTIEKWSVEREEYELISDSVTLSPDNGASVTLGDGDYRLTQNEAAEGYSTAGTVTFQVIDDALSNVVGASGDGNTITIVNAAVNDEEEEDEGGGLRGNTEGDGLSGNTEGSNSGENTRGVPASTASTIAVTLTGVDGAAPDSDYVDLSAKEVTATTNLVFGVTVEAGTLSSQNTVSIALPAGFSSLTSVTNAELTGIGTYSISERTITITPTDGESTGANANITLTDVPFDETGIPTTASQRTGTITAGTNTYTVLYPGYAPSLRGAPVAGDPGKIYVTRKTKKSASEGTTACLQGCQYTLYRNADGTDPVGTARTSAGAPMDVVFSNLAIDDTDGTTYYLKETVTSNCYAAPSISKILTGTDSAVTTGTPETDISPSATGVYAIHLSSTAPSAHLSLLGYYQLHKLELVNSNGAPISGQSIPVVPDDDTSTFFRDFDGNILTNSTTPTNRGPLTWTTGASAQNCYGTFINGLTATSEQAAYNIPYKLTVQSEDNRNIFIRFGINPAGQMVNATSSNNGKVSAEIVDNGTRLIVTRVSQATTASLQVKLVDRDNSNAQIQKSGVKYWYGTYTGTAPTAADVTSAQSANHSVVTNASGILSLSLTPDTENDTKYFLVEDATAGAPQAYVANGTDRFYTFTLEGGSGLFKNFDSNWTDSTATIKSIGYREIKGTLRLTRNDWTSASGTPGTLTYGIYTSANCSGTSVATVSLTAGANKSEGATTARLDWNTDYYIKETTDTYTGKDQAIHGPYRFSDSMATSGTVDSTTYTSVISEMSMSVVIVPAYSTSVAFRYLNASDAAAAGSFTIKKRGETAVLDTIVLSTSVTSYTVSGLFSGFTYTVTQIDPATGNPATNGMTYDLTIDSTTKRPVTPTTVTRGTVTVDNSAATSVVTMKERLAEVTITLDICTAEKSGDYDRYVDDDDEIDHKAGIRFALYDSATSTTALRFENGSAYAETNSSGAFTITGLSDRTYYLKNTTTSLDGASQVNFDTKSKFSFEVENGTLKSGSLTKLSGSDTGTWTVAGGRIRAYLKTGSVKVTAKSNKTLYLYRLYNGGSSSEDDRESQKISGSLPDDLKNAQKGSNYITVVDAGAVLKKEIEKLQSMLVLHVQAAENAKKIEHAGHTWQLIGSKNPGSGNTSTFEGLIAGQAYLIREGDSESTSSSDSYYLVKATTSTKSLTASGSTGSSGNSGVTIRSGASNSASTGTGAGTKSGSSAGGGRGAATGDGNDLWMHLIVMLIAFDALVADLLYISRKKQPVRSR